MGHLALLEHSLDCTFISFLFRWLAAVKVSHGANKDMLAAAAKADALKEEYEEETAKFEACQVSTLLYCKSKLIFFTECSDVKIVMKIN